MPPSGFDRETVEGLLLFLRGCYRQINKEVKAGKHKSTQAAVDYEIEQIGKAVRQIHVTPKGKIVKRK